ncbi:hypothetical protein MMC25_005947 [Agyrium rufum]|nr:hypothetical protein [Agyrium rufum]
MSAGSPVRGSVDGRSFPRSPNYTPPTTNRSSWQGGRRSPDSDGGLPPPAARYPHLKDLQAKSRLESRQLSIDSSVRNSTTGNPEGFNTRPTFLTSQCTKITDANVNSRRIDVAYVEWLMASEILCRTIPRHRDYAIMQQQAGDLAQRYKTLYRHNNGQYDRIKVIHETILEDNHRSGIQPTLQLPTSESQRRPSPSPSEPIQRPISMPQPKDFQAYHADEKTKGYQTPRTTPDPTPFDDRPRPVIHPKPNNLNSAAIGKQLNRASAPADNLAERFAQLRAPSSHVVNTLKDTRSSPAKAPYQTHTASSNLIHYQSAPPAPDGKPAGPRGMVPAPLDVPSLPPKIPLEIHTSSSLPRAPSPTYSPARNMQSPLDMALPRSTARSLAVNGGRSSMSGSTSSRASWEHSRPGSISGDDAPSAAKRTKLQSADLPISTAITVEELYERLQAFKILLIDIRSREDFDAGHIYAKSIICIEPLTLSGSISADELEERLVVSPEAESLLFERRNEFDLVVYYDQKTTSNQFLAGKPFGSDAKALRNIYDTLVAFNYNKELRRPPAVLLGGLDAWTELVGPQALKSSQTAAVMGSARPRRSARTAGRPISRVPMANSSLEVRKRRLRQHNPLDAKETQAWLETARQEEVESSEYQHRQTTEEVNENGELSVQLNQTYEDFLRRFPEASGIQESMTTPTPRLDSRYESPSRPVPQLPGAPSRPAPAVPRPSYSGVSDHKISEFSPTTRPSPLNDQLPLFQSRAVSHYLKLPRTGLKNFGVTCYMNATIQCLLASIPLSQFFLDNRWRDFTQKNWRGSEGIMPDLYANLIRNMWKNDVQAVAPTSFRKFCARLNPEWGIDRQQDAKEFLEFVVDCLHEDLNTNWRRTPLKPLTVEQEMRRETLPVAKVSLTEWNRTTHTSSSFISSLFSGQHASILTCQTCHNTSTSYEPFNSVSVPIPLTGKSDIQSCLQEFSSVEQLDNAWHCPTCKCERRATKRLLFARLPQLLVIHFKRFSAGQGETIKKVHTPIDFPLFGLDMAPYMANSQIDDTEMSPNAPVVTKHDRVATTPPFSYDAYAVLRHIGQTGGAGHYIALIKDASRGCWRKFDDERAVDFDPSRLKSTDKLQNEQAYIVFYGRSVAR